MTEERKTSRIGYINQSTFGDGKLYGTLYWGEQKYRIVNFISNGEVTVADVQEKTEETYTAKNGNEYPVYRNIGAIRFNRQTGDGDYVTEMAGVDVKYSFTSSIQENNGVPTRIIRFPQVSENKFRNAFDDAMDVVEESPAKQPDPSDVPF